MELHEGEVERISEMVLELCGVVLDGTKDYLIRNRLAPLALQCGCSSYGELCTKVRCDGTGELRLKVIDAITTNETFFFRDKEVFDALSYRVVPEIIDRKAGTLHSKRLRIWSAACSTGQETYSIAMALSALLPDILAWDVQILGTDISDAAVQRASRGRYDEIEIRRGLESPQLDEHFIVEEGRWRIRDELRALAQFRRINLLEPFVGLGPFDIVFCRNVGIYFSPENCNELFENVARVLVPDGILFIGAAESLFEHSALFAPEFHCNATYYRRV